MSRREKLSEHKITGVDLFHVFPDQSYNFAVPLKAFDKPPNRR